jgi:tripartite-type tricarboxylate transporter receptor subunit TctC
MTRRPCASGKLSLPFFRVGQFYPDVWQGILAPVGTPMPIVEKLNTEINAVLKTPEVRTGILRLGVADIMSMTQPEFANFIDGEAKKWPPIIKATGFKAQ